MYTNTIGLSEEEKYSISHKFTMKELEQTVKDMGNDKTPGIDGLPAEFYKVFWPEIKEYLYAAINTCFKKGELSITQRQGILSLLPKPDKDNLLLKNWRPLTLMNVDYKIITGTIAKRIQKHIDKLISPEQMGFCKGRYIGDNIYKVLNLMEGCKIQQENGMLVLLDFEKAFDMLDWNFIMFALKKLNFPTYILNWMNIIYNTKNMSCILNNGWTSTFFHTTRGTKQGCSLSPYIFIICIEFLTKAIKNHGEIQGLKLGDFMSTVIQFADDTCLTLQYNEKNIRTTFRILQDFEKASGLRLNMNKTEILKLGPISRTDGKLCPEFNINWKTDFVRLLGIFLCNDVMDMYKMNFEHKFDVSKTVVNIWHQRNLTMYGKGLIVKTFILSQWMYQITVLPVLGKEIDVRLNNIIFKFVWNNKPDKIKRKVICGNTDTGGLRYPNMSYYLKSTKIAWIKRIFSDSDLFNITSYFFKPMKALQKDVLKCNLCKDDLNLFIKSHTYTIIYEIFYNLYDINYCKWDASTQFCDQLIWLNSCIKVGRKPLFNTKCIEKGILRISDLMIDNIFFITYDEFVLIYGNIINYMEFNSIISAIKSNINAAKSNVRDVIGQKAINTDHVMNATKPQKIVYKYICDVKDTKDSSLPKLSATWHTMIDSTVDEIELSNQFISIQKTTISMKLRNFMYKYLHLKLFLNPLLFTMHIKNTEMCTFCHVYVETVDHLFYHCQYTKELWASVKIYLYNKFNFPLNVEHVNVILPSCNLPKIVRTLMYVCLYNIYNCRLRDSKPSNIGIIREFYKLEALELEIAKSNDKLHVHNEKWKFNMIN